MNKYKVSLSAVNVPEETYPMMEQTLRDGKIGQTDLIQQFEELIANYVGSKYCVVVSSGTMADAVAVAAIREKKPNIKKVLVPALTFIAQPNSVRYNSLQVEFGDIKDDLTLECDNIPPDDTIVFATDLMGKMATGIFDLEDACEAFGSKFFGFFAGTRAKMGTFSFFPSHTISTGEGGAIVTDDKELYDLCLRIRAHGCASFDPENKFRFPIFGFNARMTSLQAVLGICLMNHINEYIDLRSQNYQYMKSQLGGFDEANGEFVIPHGYVLRYISEEFRDMAFSKILGRGIECRKMFSCIPKAEKPYMQEGSFPVAERIASTSMYVPCHQNMSLPDTDFVCSVVEETLGRINI